MVNILCSFLCTTYFVLFMSHIRCTFYCQHTLFRCFSTCPKKHFVKKLYWDQPGSNPWPVDYEPDAMSPRLFQPWCQVALIFWAIFTLFEATTGGFKQCRLFFETTTGGFKEWPSIMSKSKLLRLMSGLRQNIVYSYTGWKIHQYLNFVHSNDFN